MNGFRREESPYEFDSPRLRLRVVTAQLWKLLCPVVLRLCPQARELAWLPLLPALLQALLGKLALPNFTQGNGTPLSS